MRIQGWARAEGEREPDLNAIAAPVFGATGDLAAVLGLQGPAGRFDHAAQDAALPALRRHAADDLPCARTYSGGGLTVDALGATTIRS